MLNSIWNFLNGKKTVIAEFYWTGLASINLIWFPDGIPATYNKIYLTVGIVLTFFGLGHKFIKKNISTK